MENFLYTKATIKTRNPQATVDARETEPELVSDGVGVAPAAAALLPPEGVVEGPGLDFVISGSGFGGGGGVGDGVVLTRIFGVGLVEGMISPLWKWNVVVSGFVAVN
jgi:hypothetical protein